MNTPKPSVLELAKQGDLRAITALMNRPLQAKGISADVSVQGEVLAVKLESEQSPPQEALVQFVHRGLSNLNIPKFNRAKLSGYRSGQSAPDWEQEVELYALPDFLETPTPVVVPPPPPTPRIPPVPPAPVEPPAILATDLPSPLPEEDLLELDDTRNGTVESRFPSPSPEIYPDIPLPPDDLEPPAPPSSTVDPMPLEPMPLESAPLAPIPLEEYTLVDEMDIADGASTDQSAASEPDSKSEPPIGLAGILFGAAIALLAAIIAWFAYTRFFQPQAQPVADPTTAPPTVASPPPETVAPLPTEGESPAPAPTAPAPAPADLPVPTTAEPPASPVAQAPLASAPADSTDPFGDAVTRATEAANLSQTATTIEQWQQIAQLWQDAATLMGLVPSDNPNFATAQDRVTVYLGNRNVALQKIQELGG